MADDGYDSELERVLEISKSEQVETCDNAATKLDRKHMIRAKGKLGINNPGAACWLNSAIQILFRIPELTDLIERTLRLETYKDYNPKIPDPSILAYKDPGLLPAHHYYNIKYLSKMLGYMNEHIGIENIDSIPGDIYQDYKFLQKITIEDKNNKSVIIPDDRPFVYYSEASVIRNPDPIDLPYIGELYTSGTYFKGILNSLGILNGAPSHDPTFIEEQKTILDIEKLKTSKEFRNIIGILMITTKSCDGKILKGSDDIPLKQALTLRTNYAIYVNSLEENPNQKLDGYINDHMRVGNESESIFFFGDDKRKPDDKKNATNIRVKTFENCEKKEENNDRVINRVIEKEQFVELPTIFPIEIARGSNDDKNSFHINIEKNSSLQLQLYDINGNLTGIEVKYELFAILSHESGHWTSFIKEDGVWFQYNDSCAWQITGKIDDQFWYPDMDIPVKERSKTDKTKGWNVGKNSSTDSTADIMFYRKTGTETKFSPPPELDNSMSESKDTVEVKPISTPVDDKTMAKSVGAVASSMNVEVPVLDNSAMEGAVETVASAMSTEVKIPVLDNSAMAKSVEAVTSSMNVEEPIDDNAMVKSVETVSSSMSVNVKEEPQAETPINVTVKLNNNSMEITSNGTTYNMTFDILAQLGVPLVHLTTPH